MTKKQESKQEIGLKSGSYDVSDLEIIPIVNKKKQAFNEMISSLKEGKYFVLKAGYVKNSLYLLLKKIKEQTELDVVYSTVKAKDGTIQFVIFVKKD